MTDQHRCDSMADAMVPYGPPSAQEHLRHAMRRDEWSTLPVEPIIESRREKLGYIVVRASVPLVRRVPVKPPRRHLWLLAIPAAGLVLIVLATMGVLS